MPEEKKYKIILENKAVVIVRLSQLYRKRWLEYFGGIKGIEEFLKNYKV